MTEAPPAPRRDTYHHGDLRQALVTEALRLLETGEQFSLRAVARGAGVSQAAPYRHFPDRDHLEAAVAVVGFHDLEADLRATIERAGAGVALADLGVAYVDFALRRPALFAVMFEQSCADGDERTEAVESLHRLIREVAQRVHPDSDAAALSVAGWSLAHGLAVLLRDGKLDAHEGLDADRPAMPATVEDHVRAAFAAMLAVHTEG